MSNAAFRSLPSTNIVQPEPQLTPPPAAVSTTGAPYLPASLRATFKEVANPSVTAASWFAATRFCSAGKPIPSRIAAISTTTSNSTSVKPAE